MPTEDLLASARELLDRGEFAQAVRRLAAAVEADPADPDALRALADAEQEAAAFGVTLALLSAARLRGTRDWLPAIDQLETLARHGRYREALALYETAPADLRDDSYVGAAAAEVYLALGCPALAVQAYGRNWSKSRAGERRRLWWQTGGPLWIVRAAARRREQAALAPAESASAAADPGAAARVALAQSAADEAAVLVVAAARGQREQDKPAEATRTLAASIRQAGPHPLVIREAISLADEFDRPALALDLYDALPPERLTQPDLAVARAELLSGLGRRPEALAALGDRADGATRQQRAEILLGAALPVRALDALGNPVTLPDRQWRRRHRELWWQTGGPLRFVRRRRRAAEDWTVDTWPEPEPPARTTDLAAELDRVAEAQEVLAELARADDDGTRADQRRARARADTVADAHVLLALGRSLSLDDQDEEALAVLERARALGPKLTSVINWQISVLGYLNRYRQALQVHENLPEHLAQVQEIRSATAWIYRWMGLPALELEAYGPRAGLPSWDRRWARDLWWRTGGPLWFVRSRRRARERQIVSSWQISPPRVLPELADILDPGENAGPTAMVDEYALRQSVLENRWEHRQEIAKVVVGTLGLAASAVALSRVAGHALALPALPAAAVGVGAAAVVYLVLRILMFRHTAGVTRRQFMTRTLPLLAALAGAGYAVLTLPGNGYPALLGATAVAVAAVSAARLVVLTALGVGELLALRRLRRDDPRVVALIGLLELLRALRVPIRRNDLRWRRWCLESLERVALGIEQDLAAAFGATDPRTTDHVAERARAAATALRNLKYQVTAAPPGAWRRIEATLRQAVTALATGALGRLPAAAPPPPVPARSRRRTALAIARLVLLAGLPLTAVLVARPWLEFNETVLNWARLGGFGWALLCVLLNLDPNVREKFSTAIALVSLGQAGSLATPPPDARSRLPGRPGENPEPQRYEAGPNQRSSATRNPAASGRSSMDAQAT